MPNAQLRDKLTALVATTLGELATGSASASAKDAIRDPRETNSSVASRLEVLGSQKRFPWSPWLSWPGVTQRFSALGPIARGHPQLHRQDSVEPGAAGVHLRRHLPTDPTQVVPTAFTSLCRLRKGTSECTVASGAPSRFTFGARRPERLCRQSYSFLRQRESGVSSKRHGSCCRTPPPGGQGRSGCRPKRVCRTDVGGVPSPAPASRAGSPPNLTSSNRPTTPPPRKEQKGISITIDICRGDISAVENTNTFRPCFGAFLRPKLHRDSITDRLPLRHILMRTPPTNHLKRVDFSVNASLPRRENSRLQATSPRDLGGSWQSSCPELPPSSRMLLDSLPILMISSNLG